MRSKPCAVLSLPATPGPELVHHSDCGSQYCSGDYQALLRKRAILISMSGRGNCYDRLIVKTVFKTIKSKLIWPVARQNEQQANCIGSRIGPPPVFQTVESAVPSLNRHVPTNYEGILKSMGGKLGRLRFPMISIIYGHLIAERMGPLSNLLHTSLRTKPETTFERLQAPRFPKSRGAWVPHFFRFIQIAS